MDKDTLQGLEEIACIPKPVVAEAFNSHSQLPYGLAIRHIRSAMEDFLDFLGFTNQQLHSRKLSRLEAFLMSANFSSIVGEFIATTIPKHCPNLAKNRHHNGHPDLVPSGVFTNDAAQHAHAGIEIKGSRYQRGWQGHNRERIWLMVFVFESNSAADADRQIASKPFQFLRVLGAQLEEDDWTFSGRSATSRRTITASVNRSGYDKMMANWIYDITR